MQRLTEPLLISAGTLTTFIATFSATLSHLQAIVAIGVGVITIFYTAMKVVKLYHELQDQHKNKQS